LTPACAGLLEHRGSGLELLKFSFSAENFIAVCLGLSPAISAQVTLKLCLIAQNCKKKITKNPYFEGSRSYKVIDVDTPKKCPRTSACYDKQHVRVYLEPFLR